MPIKKTLIVAALLMFITMFAVSCNNGEVANVAKSKPKVDNIAPDFTLTSIDGQAYTLSQLKGKVVFVNFWATWCPPCREEIPSMINLYKTLKGKDIVILAISVDLDNEAVKKFIADYGIPFPVLRDPEKKAYNLYKATGVPETHLINKLGVLQNSWIGGFNWTDRELIDKVEKLLAE